MVENFILSTRDVISRTNISRQRLFQIRQGFTDRHGKEHEPALSENIDFVWDEGKLFYTEESVQKIKNKLR